MISGIYVVARRRHDPIMLIRDRRDEIHHRPVGLTDGPFGHGIGGRVGIRDGDASEASTPQKPGSSLGR